jgi:CheY-like chemotaxis protein
MKAAANTTEDLRRKLSVLIADDNPDTVATLAAILTDEGHTVHTVTSSPQVAEAVQRYQPEVCILDIEMPKQSGYAVAGELRTLYGSRRPILIAISGKWYGQTDKMLAATVGFEYFFQKPADPLAVVKILDQVRSRPFRRLRS